MTCLLLLQLILWSATAAASDDAAPQWDEDPEALTGQVNEGRLRILPWPPDEPVHQHLNRIRITESSLDDGWVELEQCHQDLDPVAASQIVFHPKRIRGLRILGSEGITAARVEGASIQLQVIGPGARLCLRAESLALQRLPDGCHRLRNGPYMRRFLDGFYPMRVRLQVRFPPALKPRDIKPRVQPGLQLTLSPGLLSIDALFEGRLFTDITLCRQAAPLPLD